ncbi:Hypothetical protein NCS54_01095200 [Fusarium falciforme]|uniref:Hypothetical protein n=1 Tax=Fusarium falciforme TaxID=195108 RepID=UPI00230187E9|nr:Hypothetical protein NCS54_01095200 [Fusarium falciforme]WAO93405.1 Hypothetical protein NCS54_01095200 [Fusarium falciforme]
MTITPEPLLKQPAFTPTRKMRVVCIGAGFGGLMVAHKVQHELKLEDEIDLAIYDRNADIGGNYDVPSHSSIFSFEGNPDRSKFYVDQKGIQAYIKRIAGKYNLSKHVQSNTTIQESVWDEGSAKWRIKLEQAGELKVDEADFLINASGFLSKWKWPEIEGLHDFKGKLLHIARWDKSYQWEGKKVAVIGNGASGIQLVATMQPKVEKLVNYMRQPAWISVNFLGDKTPEGVNFTYSEEQKGTWREDPNAHYLYRKDLEQSYVSRLHAYSTTLTRLNAPDIEKRILPNFKAGCRRITPGDGYLEALQEPNCRDCWDPIECITEKGIKTSAGKGYNQYAREFLKLTVWSGECRTLYKNGRSVGMVTGLYPGSLVHYPRALAEIGGEHFDITWRSRNRFR